MGLSLFPNGLLGQKSQPNAAQSAPPQAGGLLAGKGAGGLLGDPNKRLMLAAALQGMTHNPNRAMQAMALSQMESNNTKSEQSQRMAEAEAWLSDSGRPDLIPALRAGVPLNALVGQIYAKPKDERTASQKDYEYYLETAGDNPKSYEDWRLEGKRAEGGVTSHPTYGDPPTDHVWDMDESGNVRTNEAGVPIAVPVVGSDAHRKAQEAQGEAEINEQKSDFSDLSAEQAMAIAEEVMNDPNLGSYTGFLPGRLPPLNQDLQDLDIKVKQLQGQAFLKAFNALKGAGQITENEGQAAREAISRLDRKLSPDEFKRAVQELHDLLETGVSRPKGWADGVTGPGFFADMNDDDLFNLDHTGMSDDEKAAYLEELERRVNGQ